MARQAVSAFVPACDPDIVESVSATSQGAMHTVGHNRIFAINATGDITIAFGLSSGTNANPSASNFRVPSGSSIQFDTGQAYDQFMVYNIGASTVTVYAKLFSVA